MAFTEDQMAQLKLLLDVQARGYNDSIDRLQREITDLRKHYDEKVHDLEVSLEYSYKSIEEMKKAMTPRETFLKLEKESKDEIDKVITRINKQEDYSRKYNLRIDGLEEFTTETNEQTEVKVQNMIQTYFNISNVEIDAAHRIKSPNSNIKKRCQTVLVRFKKLNDRNQILRNTRKLKNSNIYINEDLCEGTLLSRKAKIPELKNARESGKIAYFKGDKLIIKNRNLTSTSSALNQNNTPPRHVSTLRNVFSPQDKSPLPSPLFNAGNMSSNAPENTTSEVRRSSRQKNS